MDWYRSLGDFRSILATITSSSFGAFRQNLAQGVGSSLHMLCIRLREWTAKWFLVAQQLIA